MNLTTINFFDELTWLIDINQSQSFIECKLHWDNRFKLLTWLKDNCTDIIIWNGHIIPERKWPPKDPRTGVCSNNTFFILFLNKEDETHFLLKYSTNIVKEIHPSAHRAYHSVKERTNYEN